MNPTFTTRPRATSAPTAPTPAQLAMFRVQLEEQRQFRNVQLAELALLDSADRTEVTELLEAGARAALDEVSHALQRMADHSYGRCTGCDAALLVERLEVLPAAAQCLSCRQRAAELAG